MSEITNKIVHDLNEYGIAQCHITDLFDTQYTEYFNNAENFMYKKMYDTPLIQNYIEAVNNNKPAPKRWYEQSKKYEFPHYACLRRGITFDDGDIAKLYTCPKLLEIADSYYGEWCKIRNILAWINLPNSLDYGMERNGSQKWHMDTEDVGYSVKEDPKRKILKVWFYMTDIDEQTGAMEYKNLKGEKSTAIGKKGTIFFVNTAQYHRGGFVHKGNYRMILQGCYLKPSAWQINQDTHIKKLNYVSNGRAMWDLKHEHTYYKNLNKRGQFLFSDN